MPESPASKIRWDAVGPGKSLISRTPELCIRLTCLSSKPRTAKGVQALSIPDRPRGGLRNFQRDSNFKKHL